VREIARLNTQIKRLTIQAPTPADPDAIAKAVEQARAQWSREMQRVIGKDLDQMGKGVDLLKRDLERVAQHADGLEAAFLALEGTLSPNGELAVQVPVTYMPQPERLVARAPAPKRTTSPSAPAAGLSSTQQRMLDALAMYEALGVHAPTRAQLAGYLAISHTTGSFSNNLSALRTAGFIQDVANGAVALTDAGRGGARTPDAPPSLEELHELWYKKLSRTQASVLRLIIVAYPESIARQAIASALGIQDDTGSFSNNLSKLRTLGLIEDPAKGMVRATDVLFPKGLR
jgi:Mn-dependent DtxR family transcriptional regulator